MDGEWITGRLSLFPTRPRKSLGTAGFLFLPVDARWFDLIIK